MRFETDLSQENCNFSGWLFARGRPLRIIICKRPVPLDDHLIPRKGHEKCIFEALHNQIKCFLSIKESNFNGKNGSIFSLLLTAKAEAEGADPAPLTASLTVKCPFFTPPILKWLLKELLTFEPSHHSIVTFKRLKRGLWPFQLIRVIRTLDLTNNIHRNSFKNDQVKSNLLI